MPTGILPHGKAPCFSRDTAAEWPALLASPLVWACDPPSILANHSGLINHPFPCPGLILQYMPAIPKQERQEEEPVLCRSARLAMLVRSQFMRLWGTEEVGQRGPLASTHSLPTAQRQAKGLPNYFINSGYQSLFWNGGPKNQSSLKRPHPNRICELRESMTSGVRRKGLTAKSFG